MDATHKRLSSASGRAELAGDVARRLQDMFENATWGMFQTTPDGRYLAANTALARIYGYDGLPDMMRSLTDIGQQLYVEPGRREEFAAAMRADGALSGFESQVRRKSGEVIWISECCREVRDPDGTLLYYEGTVEEITGRKRTETELRLSERMLAAVLNTVEEAVLIVTAGGQIVVANDVFRDWVGLPLEDIIGSDLGKIVVTDRDEELPHLASQSAPYRRVLRLRNNRGGHLAADTTATRLPGSTGKAYLVIAMTLIEGRRPQPGAAMRESLAASPAGRHRVVASRVHLVGLSDVQSALGAQWASVAPQALAIAEATIRRHLGPADTLEQLDGESFVICFGALDEEEAVTAARIIGRAVREKLLGSADGAAEQVAAYAGAVELDAAELAATGTVSALLKDKLEVLKETSEKRVQALLKVAVSGGRFHPRPVYQSTGEAAPFHLARFAPELQGKLDQAVAGLAAESESAFEADLVMLGVAADWATQRVAQGEAALLLAPVHAGTLMSRRNLNRYVELCRNIPPAARGSLMLELVDLPADILPGRVLEIAQTLMPHARGIALELPPGHELFDLFGAKSPIATVNRRALPRNPEKDERFLRQVKSLRARKTKLVAKDVRSKDEALKLAKAGIELVSFVAE